MDKQIYFFIAVCGNSSKKGIIENAFNPALSNGALMDIGVYCVHPLVSLFEKPEKVLSSSLKLSNGIDGAGTVLVEYPGFQGELLEIPETENNMVYEIREFLRLIEEKDYNHKYLENSRLEMELMDEVRRQQEIVFPADEN